MVVLAASHEQERPETAYILPFPALPPSFRADSALAKMVGSWAAGPVASSLIFSPILTSAIREWL